MDFKKDSEVKEAEKEVWKVTGCRGRKLESATGGVGKEGGMRGREAGGRKGTLWRDKVWCQQSS